MKIDQVTLRHVSMPLRSPFETSFGRSEARDCILLEAQAGDLTGYGECVADRDPGYSYETVQTAWHILSDFILPAVLGTGPGKPAGAAAAHGFRARPPDGQSRSGDGAVGPAG